MHRRQFLKNATAIPFAGSAAAVPDEPPAAPELPHSWLAGADIADLQRRMQTGEATARSLTEACLARIAAVDRSGPALHSVIELNPDALTIAGDRDQERRAGRSRGHLHGIPVLLKDNIFTGDRMTTTAGSLALEGFRAKEDAFVVQRLRDAGAVILGKTNLSEWANFRSSRSTSGWSSRGGLTKNPHALDHNASGSSSGAAAAVAAGLCAVAVGTETNGSIIAPSAFCGIVGLKPTVGLVSRTGIIPISASQDTAGPMTRTVRDAAALLTAMAGVDAADPVTGEAPGRGLDYTRFLDRDALKGARIGYENSFSKGSTAVVACWQAALDALRAAGATLVGVDLLAATAPLGGAEMEVLTHEFRDGLNRCLSAAGAPVTSLAALIAFNRGHAERVMPHFGQELLELSERKGPLTDPVYLKARETIRQAGTVIDALMREHRLTAIAGVSIGLPFVTDLTKGDANPGFYFCSPAAMAGYPHLTVPMGFVRGLPLGLSFIAGAWQDGAVLGLGYAFEQATRHRAAPRFHPHARD